MRFQEYLTERGDKQTELVESAQCIGIAIWQIKGSLSENDLTVQNAKKASKYFDIGGTSIEKVIEFLDENPKWITSTVNIVDAMLNRGILKRKGYVAHRDSKFIKQIYYKFKVLKGSAEKIIGPIGLDKWNPGDIWLSTLKGKIPFFENLAEYNRWITNKFQSGELISVSLKKAEKPNPPVKIYNKFDEDTYLDVQFQRIKQVKHPFSIQGMDIITSDDKMTARSFYTAKKQDIQLEIIGKEAAGGKIRLEMINNLLKNFISEEVITAKEIENMSDDERVSKMKELYNSIGMNFPDEQYEEGFTEKTEASIEKYGEDYRVGWWISKLQALDLCSKLSNNRENANRIITYIYLYASSQGLPEIFKGSLFVKVGH